MKKKFVFIGSALLLVILAVLVFRGLLENSRHPLFCAGVNPKTGEEEFIRFLKSAKESGSIWMYTKSADGSHEVLKFEDPKGAIENSGPQGRASRVSFHLGDKGTLQIYRECGPKSICRLEHIQHMSPAEYEQAQQNLVNLEREAFKARQKTSLVADKFSAVKKQIDSVKKTSAKKKRLENEASELFGELHSLSTSTEDLHRQLRKLKEDVQSRGAHVETTSLETSQVNDWCSDLERH
jgi:hypothetical protein